MEVDDPGPLLPDLTGDLWSIIFKYAGARGATVCGKVCASWRDLVTSSQLWSFFVRDFGIDAAQSSHLPWRAFYKACAEAQRQHPATYSHKKAVLHPSTGPVTGYNNWQMVDPHQQFGYNLLPLRALEHTDASNEYGVFLPLRNALAGQGQLHACWSTSRNCNKNVVALAELECGLALVLAVGAVNPGPGFDNGVKDLLVFGSMQKMAVYSSPFDEGVRGAHAQACVDRALQIPEEGQALPPHAPRPAAGEPLAGLRFPPYPECSGMQLIKPCVPTVCRFIKFHILSSHNPARHEDSNVDVSKLQVFGIPLGQTGLFDCLQD